MRQISLYLNPQLIEIYQRTQKIKALNDILSNYLPAHLQAHFSVGNFNNGYLTLTTSDPVWASQLRYLLPELRDNLRNKAGIYQLTSIQIHISASDDRLPPKPRRKIPPISTDARDMILAGSQLCNYAPLKDALEQLAIHIDENHRITK